MTFCKKLNVWYIYILIWIELNSSNILYWIIVSNVMIFAEWPNTRGDERSQRRSKRVVRRCSGYKQQPRSIVNSAKSEPTLSSAVWKMAEFILRLLFKPHTQPMAKLVFVVGGSRPKDLSSVEIEGYFICENLINRSSLVFICEKRDDSLIIC